MLKEHGQINESLFTGIIITDIEFEQVCFGIDL